MLCFYSLILGLTIPLFHCQDERSQGALTVAQAGGKSSSFAAWATLSSSKTKVQILRFSSKACFSKEPFVESIQKSFTQGTFSWQERINDYCHPLTLCYFLCRDDHIHHAIIAIEEPLPNLITTALDLLPEVDTIQRVIGTFEVVGEVSFVLRCHCVRTLSTIITHGRECQMHANFLPHSSFFDDFRYGSS